MAQEKITLEQAIEYFSRQEPYFSVLVDGIRKMKIDQFDQIQSAVLGNMAGSVDRFLLGKAAGVGEVAECLRIAGLVAQQRIIDEENSAKS